MIAEWEAASRAVRQVWHPLLPAWATFSAIVLAYLALCVVGFQRWREKTHKADRAREQAQENAFYDGTPTIFEDRWAMEDGTSSIKERDAR